MKKFTINTVYFYFLVAVSFTIVVLSLLSAGLLNPNLYQKSNPLVYLIYFGILVYFYAVYIAYT